jgi:hypothetical protein
LLLNATQALKRIFDRVDPFLKDDWLARHGRTLLIRLLDKERYWRLRS